MRTLGHFSNAFIAPPTPGTDEPQPKDVIPFGKYGGGGWAGHPIGLVIVVGVMLVGLIGLPPIRLFFLLASLIGALVGFFLWRRHRQKLFQREIVPLGQLGGTPLSGRLVGTVFFAIAVLLTELIDVRVPIVKLFFFVAVPVGCVVGFALWAGHRQEPRPLIPRKH